ncbi:hypothetical protein Y032_0433g1371 [Ancylostoma ceylanicum]|uniref:Uncharacterized protein n=1 Tax=Ancylostoma ceylanicum TaxID=53326 RepID=A0A016X1X1_9BILA|nr:hypothetical protein Y032_0433g1371 [Ancylostoma ceylanicum]
MRYEDTLSTHIVHSASLQGSCGIAKVNTLLHAFIDCTFYEGFENKLILHMFVTFSALKVSLDLQRQDQCYEMDIPTGDEVEVTE